METKIIYVVLDGLGDLPLKELKDKTPLEAANTPCLDRLASEGMLGVVFPVGKGIAPESDIAVISLLGYDAHQYYTGRGPLECFAEGLSIEEGNLAWRVNFATIDKTTQRIIDRRVGRSLTTQEAEALSKEINSKVKLDNATFEFKNTVGHRGVLVIRSLKGKLSGWVTNTDPAYEREGVFGIAKKDFPNKALECRPMPGYEQEPTAKKAADLTNEFIEKSQIILENSLINKKRLSQGKIPANIILARDAGDHLPQFPTIKERFGSEFGSFVQMPVERGIALLTGIKALDSPSPTGHFDVDYSILAKLLLENLISFDGLYIHIKGPDEPAHDGEFLKKKEIIEAIDKYFFKKILTKLDKEKVILAVTADHSTPCSLKAHSADPVPLLIWGKGIKSKEKKIFSEREASKGSVGRLLGKEVLGYLVDLSKR